MSDLVDENGNPIPKQTAKRNQQLRAEWIRASGQQAALQSLNPGGREWDRMERKVRDIAWLAKCVRDQILSMRDDANRFDEGTAHGVNWKHDPGNILRSHARRLEKMLQQLELRS